MAQLPSNQPVNPVWSTGELKAWGRDMNRDLTGIRKARMAQYAQSGIIGNTFGGQVRLGLLGLRKTLFRR
jgi:hypothetical protein